MTMATGSTPRKFNDVLVDELRERGMTNKNLADLIDVSENTVSNWTTGTYTPRHPRMERIAGALNLTIDELHGRAAPAALQPGSTSSSTPAALATSARRGREAERIVAALAALDLEGMLDAVQRATPPLMEILAAARRHADGDA